MRLIAATATGAAALVLAGPAAAAPHLARVASGFSSPVQVTAPRGDARLFVVEQAGRIWTLRAGKRSIFLDIRSEVASGGETGLLSVAFHPQFATNGRIFVDYTARPGGQLETRIAEFTVRNGKAVRASERLLLRIAQPYDNHNGGQLQFGPDGLLYIGMGDGGSGGDPENRAQNPKELLGKLLRIDVDQKTGASYGGYGIPAANPYARGGGRAEIYALGVRNPWRFSFDRQTGDLWVGDVGQDTTEEIDHLRRGAGGLLNLGWDAWEGNRPYDPKPTPGRLIRPVATYTHADGCSITGGFVVRGTAAPSLRGRYVYADFCSNWIRSMRASGPARRTQFAGVGGITSFGEGGGGNVYLVSAGTGALYKLVG